MNTTATNNANVEIHDGGAADVAQLPTGMHHPVRSELDSEGLAYQDEALHDAALRESTLRVPR